jgi:hypothetical protein
MLINRATAIAKSIALVFLSIDEREPFEEFAIPLLPG